MRKKNRKEGYYKTDDEHDIIRSTFRKHVHYRDQKEMKNSLLTDYAIESKTKDVKTNVGLTEIKTALKKQIYRDIYRAQAVRYNCIRIDKQPVYNVEVKNAELPRGILNLIESLIEGQFFKEAIEELCSLQAHYVPPVCLLHALLENVLQLFFICILLGNHQPCSDTTQSYFSVQPAGKEPGLWWKC